MKKITAIMAMALLSATYAFSQQVTPQPSPGATVTQAVGLTKLSIDYSRPSLKGREIFGKLIPFGKVWRTGANGSTKIETSTDMMIEGQKLAAGKYSIMSFPDVNEWSIVFNKDLGVSEQTYQESGDVLRVKVKPMANGATESFTIDFSDIKSDAANLNIYWDKTKVTLKISVATDTFVENAIAKQSNDAANALQSGADYWMTKDPSKSLALVNQSISLKETFRNNWTKAQLLDKMGKPAEAVQFATKAQELGANDSIYPFFKDGIEKGIADFKAKIPAVPAVNEVIKGKKKKS